MKALLIFIVVLVVGIAGFYWFNAYIYNEKQNGEGGSLEIVGTVQSVNLEQMMVDGPGILVVQTTTGAPYTVAVPSMGLPLCAAYTNIADVTAIRVGDQVSVRGALAPDNSIVPCEATDHFLRVTQATPMTEDTLLLRMAETGETLDVSITPRELLEDSRCPADVQCIQAGTVRIMATISSGLGTGEQELELGQTITTEAELVTLTDVIPMTEADQEVADSEYMFEFTIEKR
jgi:hypothetical protein